ncbi:hypothetical protein PRIO_5489 [Paenibacillus riograndensis SBR5]|uniref:Uncharacterized protein n=1 Tax=Paenibacillus riograndensis SBR5 TaxID=1073571 RepID=A0A0E4HH44_9BACL|nr:hypothetical protein PRIO_5489 [Paenibacillus riograndensis SBR5]
MEEKFGTGGAVASAFICGFPPRTAVTIKKSADNSGRKSKHSPESRRSPLCKELKFTLYTRKEKIWEDK